MQIHPEHEWFQQLLPEKKIICIPCPDPLKKDYPQNLVKLYHQSLNDPQSTPTFPEYGLLCKHQQQTTNYYYYIEAMTSEPLAQTFTLPAGTYHCQQSSTSILEHASQLLQKQQLPNDNYLAVEVECFTDKQDLEHPINELRILTW